MSLVTKRNTKQEKMNQENRVSGKKPFQLACGEYKHLTIFDNLKEGKVDFKKVEGAFYSFGVFFLF